MVNVVAMFVCLFVVDIDGQFRSNPVISFGHFKTQTQTNNQTHQTKTTKYLKCCGYGNNELQRCFLNPEQTKEQWILVFVVDDDDDDTEWTK